MYNYRKHGTNEPTVTTCGIRMFLRTLLQAVTEDVFIFAVLVYIFYSPKKVAITT